MEFEVNSQSWLYIPAASPEPKHEEPNRYGWKTFLLEYYREHEFEAHLKSDIENAGGIICGVVRVPHWNLWGQRIGDHFVVVYVAAEEIGVGVWT